MLPAIKKTIPAVNLTIPSCLLRKKRRKIHTATKWLVFHNALPERFLKQLDKSQISRYRNLKFDDYLGNELCSFSEGAISLTRHVGKYEFDYKVIRAYIRLATAARSVFASAKHFHKTFDLNKDFLVDVIQDVKAVIPLKRCAKFLGLSSSTLRNWIRQVWIECSGSLVNICRRQHPHQILESESNTMRILLADESFRFWPLRSLYFYALNNKLVSMCQSTWYKYAGFLNVDRLKPKSLKEYKESVRAEFPNQYWHADVSYFKTENGVKNYIYSVIDNFSKFPIVLFASDTLCGKLSEMINLVVDGGSENFNGSVNEFLEGLDKIDIRRIRALKDVSYSNSMAEVFFRIAKTYYLNHMNIGNTQKLVEACTFLREDFGYVRPHGSFNGLTPFEVYSGKNPSEVSFTSQISKARKMRVKANQSFVCDGCIKNKVGF